VVRVQDGVYFGVVSLLLPDRLTAEHILTPSDTDGATLSSGCRAAPQTRGVCVRVGKAAAGAHEDEKHAVLVAQCNDRSLQPHAPERSSVSHARQAVRTGRCQPRGRTAGATRTSAGLAAIALIAATPPCGHSVRGFLSSGRALRRRRCRCSDGAPHADCATCVGRDDQTAERVRNGHTPRLGLPRTMQSNRSISRRCFGSSGCRCAPTHTQHSTMHAVAREADGTRREGHGGERPPGAQSALRCIA
jgi:hypothetical protein